MSKKTKSQKTGYNPESWTQEWARKNKESKKLKGYPGTADILPACENDEEGTDDGSTAEEE